MIIFDRCHSGGVIVSLLQQRTLEPHSSALVVVYWHTPFWLLLNACPLQLHCHMQLHSLPDYAGQIVQLYRRKQWFRGVSGWRTEGLHALVFRAVVAWWKTVESLQVAHARLQKVFFAAVVARQSERCLTGQVAALHDLARAVTVAATPVGQVMVAILFGGTGAVLQVQESEGVAELAAVRCVH